MAPPGLGGGRTARRNFGKGHSETINFIQSTKIKLPQRRKTGPEKKNKRGRVKRNSERKIIRTPAVGLTARKWKKKKGKSNKHNVQRKQVMEKSGKGSVPRKNPS